MAELARAVALEPNSAMDVARGVSRLLFAEGLSSIVEFSLPNNRRLHVAALGPDGTIAGIEIKISVADLKADDKWPDYLAFCDLFYFAVPPEFPQNTLPSTTGLIVADRFGGTIIRSAVVAGMACAFVACAYAELASSVGGSGAAYGYAYAAFGELPAWTIGWNLLFGLGTALAAVANGWSGYFNNALAAMGIGLPEFLTKGPFAGRLINLPAEGIILTLMLALFAGVKQSSRLKKIIVFAKLLVIAI